MTHWLLTLTVDGREYRWTDSLEVVDASDGDELLYLPGLGDPGDLAQGGDVSITVDDESVDWSTVGPELEGVIATLQRWTEGTVLEAAEVYARGEVVGAQWGSRYDQVSFAIGLVTGSSVTLGIPLPPSTAQVDETTWPVTALHTAGATGGRYPLVFGYPGFKGGSLPSEQVVPVPLAQWKAATTATTYVVVSEDPDAPITQVRIRNDDTDTNAPETVTQVVDLAGKRVLVASFALNAGPMPASESAHCFAGYRPSTGGGVAVTAYEAIAYVLGRFGPDTVDWEALAAAKDILDQFQVDTWIEDQLTDPWAWIESVLLPDLPVELRSSTRGRFLLPRRWTAAASRAIDSLSADTGQLTRTSRIARDGSGPINEWTASYRLCGEWLGRVVLSGDPAVFKGATTSSASQAVTVITTAAARASFARYRLRTTDPVEIDWTWDTGTIARCLEVRAERDALPSGIVGYDMAVGGEELREGDEVLLTDSEMGWDEIPVLIDAPPTRGDALTSLLLRVPLP